MIDPAWKVASSPPVHPPTSASQRQPADRRPAVAICSSVVPGAAEENHMDDQEAWYERFATALVFLPWVFVLALLFLALVGIVFLYD